MHCTWRRSSQSACLDAEGDAHDRTEYPKARPIRVVDFADRHHVVGFFAVLLWLKPHNATFILVLTAVAAIFVMVYTGFLARRVERRMDEVQVASQRFATFHGGKVGMGVALLLMLPPVTNRLIDLTDLMTAGAPNIPTRHRAAVLLGLYFGYMLLVLTQAACTVVASLIWQRRMGLREPS